MSHGPTGGDGILGLLCTILKHTASFPDAACKGRHELFDPRGAFEDQDGADKRHQQAIQLCHWRCPHLDACAAWLDSVPGHLRPGGGVVAGRKQPEAYYRKKKAAS